MKKAFKWLCLTCFCIVLAAVPLGILELAYLDEPKATVLRCRVGEYANIFCGDGALSAVKEIILNLPFGFAMAPAIGARPGVLGILNPLQSLFVYANPLLIYIYVLNLILVLAIIHLVRMIVRLTIGRWKKVDA